VLLRAAGPTPDWPTRPPITGSGGMVATTQPVAARIGVDVLAEGGTAADAAVAVAAALAVAEPRSNGIGGDLMALYWPGGADRPVALNASGRAPAAMTVHAVRELGVDRMPHRGPWSATVPGAVSGWAALHERFGALPWARLLDPAIRLAEEGVEVGPRTAAGWKRSADRLAPDSVYLPGGAAPPAGTVMRTPQLASTLRCLVEEGPAAMYTGSLAGRVAEHAEGIGGPMRAGDLAGHRITWEEPIRGSFRGVEVWELGPNTQGAVAIIALGLLDRYPPDPGADRVIRALELAFDEASRSIGDASRATIDPKSAIERLAGRMNEPPDDDLQFPPGTDTVFTAVADREGTLCSLSTSMYDGFGSGVEIPGTGIVLHNRAAGFSLEKEVDLVGPGRRPYHTLVPATVADGPVRAAVGFVGAFMQPQAQTQTLVRMLDQGHDPQAAIDAPRLRVEAGGSVSLEDGLADTADGLRGLGYRVRELETHRAGVGQFVAVDGGRLVGGSDSRHDGRAVAVSGG
jgi:gamma-glutamyltranspeptidase/glutathione hydrolase